MPKKPTYEELKKRVLQLEQALAEKQTNSDSIILKTIPDIMFRLSRDGVHLDFHSPSLGKLFVKPNEFLGRNVKDVLPEDVSEKYIFHIRKAIEENNIQSFVYKLDFTPQDTRYYEARLNPISEDEVLVIVREITDQRKSERDLRRHQRMLARTEKITHVGSWEWEIATDTVTWSKELFRIFQLDPKDTAPSWSEHPNFYHPEDFRALREAVDAAVTKGVPYKLELRAIRKDGEIRVCHATGLPEMGSNGKTTRLAGSLHDITDLKHTEDTLREQTKTLENILEHAADGICVCHNIPDEPYVKFTHWNPRMTEITGYTMEEINQAGWYQSMYPDPTIQQKAIERMTHMRQGENIKSEEWIITRKDKKQKALSISTSVIKEENGEIHVMALMQDIDERRRYQDQLLTSWKEWEDIFQAIGQPTIILDPEHGIIKANKATLKLTGLTENQLKERKCFDLFHGKGEPPESCPMEALINKNSLDTVEMEMETLGGTFLVSCTPIIDQDGSIEKIIHIATDITKTKELEADLRHAQKIEAIGTLAGGIAHEFNNMLGIIIGNAELAKDDIPEWNPAANCVEEIRSASLRAKDVVRKLLNVARKTPIKKNPVQISTIVKESLDLLRKTIPSSIKIERDILCTTETILADPTEIHQVLINLFTNSQHAMHEETGVIHVSLATIPHERLAIKKLEDLKPVDYVELRVRDTGEGIHPDSMARVLDPYYTTKEVDQGLGMGLAVVHGIVKEHDGAIKIESEVGKGTTVEVLFPLIEKQEVVCTEETDTPQTGTERILLVDDESSLVKMFTQMLERSGYEVVGKTSSADALSVFKEDPERFDLVITDMAMPDMAGDRLAQKIIQIRSNIPIILCTGHSDRMNESKAKKLGIKAFAMKPLGKADLTKTVRKVLDEAKSKSCQ